VPDGLYERDVLAWSQHQADLLRRLGRGERVNDIDWANVAEEVEDLGLSELHSVESVLDLFIVHLLKVATALHALDATTDRRGKIIRRGGPGNAGRQRRRRGTPGAWPDANPFSLDDLLAGDHTVLLARLTGEAP
jgi:hypothetical protein